MIVIIIIIMIIIEGTCNQRITLLGCATLLRSVLLKTALRFGYVTALIHCRFSEVWAMTSSKCLPERVKEKLYAGPDKVKINMKQFDL